MNYFALSPVFHKFTLLLAFSIAGNAYANLYYDYGDMDFFLFATVTSWIFVMAFFVLFAFNIVAKINLDLDWNLPVITEFMLHATFNILLRMCPFSPNEKCLDDCTRHQYFF